MVEVTVNGESSASLLPFMTTRTVIGTFVQPPRMNAASDQEPTAAVRGPVIHGNSLPHRSA